jgi:hypothetical protein
MHLAIVPRPVAIAFVLLARVLLEPKICMRIGREENGGDPTCNE